MDDAKIDKEREEGDEPQDADAYGPQQNVEDTVVSEEETLEIALEVRALPLPRPHCLPPCAHGAASRAPTSPPTLIIIT